VVITGEVSNVTESSAQCEGIITSDGGSDVISRGICWSTSPNPTVSDNISTEGSGTGVFTGSLSGLSQLTKYYIRAYATNISGAGYGEEVVITTSGFISDDDGNSYKTLFIGTQVWMQENLKTTRLNDGTAISEITDIDLWEDYPSPAYCWYDFNSSNKNTLGALYHWHTVETNKVCPVGWHVPTESEWLVLFNYLGGVSVAGGKLKDAGSNYWEVPNVDATNESGFSARGAGILGQYLGWPVFDQVGELAGFWSSTSGKVYTLTSGEGSVGSSLYEPEKRGLSIRCIKND
jgi:uncharacterized protein (TIGR02145 family)